MEKDLMKMHWHCQACFLEGREDYTKPMEDFNVRCPADFVSKLLPQGAWTRCSGCVRKLRGRHGEAGEVGAQLHNARQAADAAARTYTCKVCGEEKPRAAFWAADWIHKGRGIACRACENAA